MSRFINPVPQFYLNNGDIASTGKLYFYETGTTTKKDTYSDFPQSIKNTNPVILSGEGRCPNIFGEGRYTVVFKDSNDIEQWSRDDVELSVEIGQYADWSPILTYRVNDIARGSDGDYYRSITSTNTGNNPITSPANWEEIAFFPFWNTNATYDDQDLVIFSGTIYRSLSADNQGNTPDSSAEWTALGVPFDREINTGYGLDGGGDLSEDRTLRSLLPSRELGATSSISGGQSSEVLIKSGTGFDSTVTINSGAWNNESCVIEIANTLSASSSWGIIIDSSAVTAAWSGSRESINGYRIRGGSSLRLVRTGENNYVAIGVRKEIVELDGLFAAGESVTIESDSRIVTISSNGILSAGTSSNVLASAVGAIPAGLRPAENSSNVYFTRVLSETGYFTMDLIQANVDTAGTLTLEGYRANTDGSGTGELTLSDSITAFSISYSI